MSTFKYLDYPALFQVADSASINSQKKFFLYLRAYLTFLVIAAFVSYQWPESQLGAIISASNFLVTIFLLIAMRVEKPDVRWYSCRALAESVKTITWRWMMHANPYQEKDEEQRINQDLKELLVQNSNLASVFPSVAEAKTITNEMTRIRNMDFEERKEFYIEKRIKDQQQWYLKKSHSHKKSGTLWFIVSIILHAIAIILLLIRIKDYHCQFPIEVIATASSALLTWIQAKKYNELTAVYSLTAHEISFIVSEAVEVNTDEELSNYVVNSENAFSREHTQWYSKKVVC
jgi:hypothetical protein